MTGEWCCLFTLCCVLPATQEILPGKTAEMVGRRGGLSATWLKDQLEKPGKGAVVQAVQAMWGRKGVVAAGTAAPSARSSGVRQADCACLQPRSKGSPCDEPPCV